MRRSRKNSRWRYYDDTDPRRTSYHYGEGGPVPPEHWQIFIEAERQRVESRWWRRLWRRVVGRRAATTEQEQT